MKLSFANFLLVAIASSAHATDNISPSEPGSEPTNPVQHLNSLKPTEEPITLKALEDVLDQWWDEIPTPTKEEMVRVGLVTPEPHLKAELVPQIYESGLVPIEPCTQQEFGRYTKQICRAVAAVKNIIGEEVDADNTDISMSEIPVITTGSAEILKNTEILATALCIKASPKPKPCNDWTYVNEDFMQKAVEIQDIIEEIPGKYENPLLTVNSPTSIEARVKNGKKPVEVIGRGNIESIQSALDNISSTANPAPTQKKLSQKERAYISLEVVTTMSEEIFGKRVTHPIEHDPNESESRSTPVPSIRAPVSNESTFKADFMAGVLATSRKPQIVPNASVKYLVQAAVDSRETLCAVPLGILVTRICGYNTKKAEQYFDYYVSELPFDPVLDPVTSPTDAPEKTASEFFCQPFEPSHYTRADRLYKKLKPTTSIPDGSTITREQCSDLIDVAIEK